MAQDGLMCMVGRWLELVDGVCSRGRKGGFRRRNERLFVLQLRVLLVKRCRRNLIKRNKRATSYYIIFSRFLRVLAMILVPS